MGRLEKSCEYLAWRHFTGAVLDVFLENQRNEAGGSLEASADLWVVLDALRQDLWRRARGAWCQRAREDGMKFPYSVDGVAMLYLRFRKRNPGEIESFRTEIEVGHGQTAPVLFE
jgi:hypothetical protein